MEPLPSVPIGQQTPFALQQMITPLLEHSLEEWILGNLGNPTLEFPDLALPPPWSERSNRPQWVMLPGPSACRPELQPTALPCWPTLNLWRGGLQVGQLDTGSYSKPHRTGQSGKAQ